MTAKDWRNPPRFQPADRFRAVITALLVALSLAGCAIIQKPPERQAGIDNPAAWQAHKQRLARLQQWALQGRVASGQGLAWTGNLNWRQDGDHFIVRLSGPVGAGGFLARGTLDKVYVRTGEQRFTTRQPDTLAERILGFAFPLSALRYWARGLPAPGRYERISVGSEGRLKSLRQNGWRVAFVDYTTLESGLKLPRKIVLADGQNRLQLVVDRWFDVKTRSGTQG